jgi:hypothetical protein
MLPTTPFLASVPDRWWYGLLPTGIPSDQIHYERISGIFII